MNNEKNPHQIFKILGPWPEMKDNMADKHAR